MRTNAALGRDYLSLKLRSRRRARSMPRPAPLFEIFVYHPLVEGIHLRGGHVARGGIRWSDRREDYRSEVLGLMKAQTVKNAVIVPVGAKGGFILRAPPSERDALREEVRLRYSTLIRGMLDVTDNIAGGEVVRPEGVRAFDEDDPYLVVAADKGTAALSDTANEIAIEYGFWLGDAFASGGSKGYDHKALGITARGAWESVKRHFRELGRDVDSRPFTVAGIGDMSGDVFGNGMLLSRQIQLVAAFDHRHVFLDPSPDAATSFAERERLFALGAGTSWTDYDKALISPGGGVWSRTEKSVPLSPRCVPHSASMRRPSIPTSSCARSCARRSTCSGTAASAPSSRPRTRRTRRSATATPTPCAWTGASCARAWSARAATSGSRSAAASSTRRPAAASTPMPSTTRPASTARTTRSTSRSCSARPSRRGTLTLDERDTLLAAAADEVCELVLYDNYLQAQILSQEQEPRRSASRRTR